MSVWTIVLILAVVGFAADFAYGAPLDKTYTGGSSVRVEDPGGVYTNTLDAFDASPMAICGDVATGCQIGDAGVLTTVEGSLNVDQAATFDSTLGVTGAADLNSTLDVAGATDLAASGLLTNIRGTLSVDEAATFDSTVNIFSGGTTASPSWDSNSILRVERERFAGIQLNTGNYTGGGSEIAFFLLGDTAFPGAATFGYDVLNGSMYLGVNPSGAGSSSKNIEMSLETTKVNDAFVQAGACDVSGPYTGTVDVSDCNRVNVTTTGGNVVIQGFTNGTSGQVVRVIHLTGGGTLEIDRAIGAGSQRVFFPSDSYFIPTNYGGACFVLSSDWRPCGAAFLSQQGDATGAELFTALGQTPGSSSGQNPYFTVKKVNVTIATSATSGTAAHGIAGADFDHIKQCICTTTNHLGTSYAQVPGIVFGTNGVSSVTRIVRSGWDISNVYVSSFDTSFANAYLSNAGNKAFTCYLMIEAS